MGDKIGNKGESKNATIAFGIEICHLCRVSPWILLHHFKFKLYDIMKIPTLQAQCYK